MIKQIILKKKKAQQLIEFLLIAPFFIALLIIIIEYVYAINIDMTFSNGLKKAVSEVSQSIDSTSTKASINNSIFTKLSIYMDEHIGTSDIKSFNSLDFDNTTVYVATYDYKPVFSLPTLYFNIIPERFNFVASSSMPKVLNNGVGYTSSYSNAILNNIFNTSNGIMNNTVNAPVSMVFLIPVNTTFLPNAYTIISWNGNILKNGTDYTLVSLNDGMLYNCNTLCNPTGVSSLSLIGSSKNIMFINDSAISLDLSNIDAYINNYWVTPVGTTLSLSNTNVDGILKRAVAISEMYPNLKTPMGNYDNIKMDSNAENKYKVKTSNDIVIVYTDVEANYVTSFVGY